MTKDLAKERVSRHRPSMRLHFQDAPFDIYFSVGYAISTSVILLASGSGHLAGILLVAFVPGYLLVAAIFPGQDFPWAERFLLSVGLSIVIVPLLGLLLNFAPFGVRFASIILSIVTFSALVGFVALIRRRRLAPGDRLSATLNLDLRGWTRLSRLDKVLTIMLITILTLAAVSFVYVVLSSRPAARFTEFYILGPGQNASDYPTRLNSSQPGIVVLGLFNHEGTEVAYSIRIDLVAIQISNLTAGPNETKPGTLSWVNLTIPNEERWNESYAFSISTKGTWWLKFFLFKNDDLAIASAELRLPIQVV